MARTIMPVFKSFQEEGKIVGRLLAGYGELEFRLFGCLAATMDNDADALRIIFGVRRAESRIQRADKQMRGAYRNVGLHADYLEAIADLNWCRLLRNQYAHSHWYEGRTKTNRKFGLSILNLEKSAEAAVSGPFMTRRDYINIGLLHQQEEYYIYLSDCLLFLEMEYQRLVEKIPGHSYVRPTRMPRPRKYSDNPIY
jgi:hypothetical protein